MLQIKEKNFVQTIGRRKTAVAKVNLIRGTGQIIINGKPLEVYTQADDRAIFTISLPLKLHDKLVLEESNLVIKVSGGGITGQAKAIQLGIARALLVLDSESRPILKEGGLLTRDSRCKERKKYGLKKARKAPQFSKR